MLAVQFINLEIFNPWQSISLIMDRYICTSTCSLWDIQLPDLLKNGSNYNADCLVYIGYLKLSVGAFYLYTFNSLINYSSSES